MKEVTSITYKNFNERDIEMPFLLESVERALPEITSLLDVGAYYSGHTYASSLRSLLKNRFYNGIDILDPDRETFGLLNTYYVGNVTEQELPVHDYVACISVIEHCGMSTYKRDDIQAEQLKVFKKLVELTGKRLFLTCPYGMPGEIKGQYSNITPELLDQFKDLAKEKLPNQKTTFYYNKFPQGRLRWFEVDKEFADKVPLDPSRGAQGVLILEFSKE